jgi:FMN phosphatase YigB (HAD superfamily)
MDIREEIHKREEAGVGDRILPEDLYADAVPCIRAIRAAGYRVGVVGNQPVRAEAALAGLGLELDLFGSSATWGVEKPDPRFFARIATELGLATGRDRLRRRSARQ